EAELCKQTLFVSINLFAVRFLSVFVLKATWFLCIFLFYPCMGGIDEKIRRTEIKNSTPHIFSSLL
ncbi:MAG: hypothetical protein UDL61_10235, partial [Ruminococcus callidus]|uniref:hypothetical protein n=1 Tax=Ruminococcus callidus TaxID=40519 RepID=UPI002E77A24E